MAARPPTPTTAAPGTASSAPPWPSSSPCSWALPPTAGSRRSRQDPPQGTAAPGRQGRGGAQQGQQGQAPHGAGGGHWLARTWNIWLWPHSGAVPGGAAREPVFSCQASSLAFLADQGMDLGQCVAAGVPFMPLAERDALLAQLHEELGAEPADLTPPRSPTSPGSPAAAQQQRQRQQQRSASRSAALARVALGLNPSEQRLVAAAKQRACTWLSSQRPQPAGQLRQGQQDQGLGGGQQEGQQEAAMGGGLGGSSLRLAAPSQLLASFIEDRLRLELQGRPDLPSFTSTLHSPSPPPRGSRSPPASPGQGTAAGSSRQDWEVQLTVMPAQPPPLSPSTPPASPPTPSPSSPPGLTPLAPLAAVHQAAGAALVAEALRDSRVPLVLHNAQLDLAYLMHHLVAGELPGSWPEYKDLVGRTFPQVWDTKAVVACLLAPGTAPQGRLLAGRPVAQMAQQPLQELHAALMDPELGAALDLPLTQHPIRHAPGFVEYEVLAPAPASPPTPSLHSAQEGEGEGGGAAGLQALCPPPAAPLPPPPSTRLHEAGYDAFITGAVFARLLELAALRPPSSPSPKAPPTPPARDAARASPSSPAPPPHPLPAAEPLKGQGGGAAVGGPAAGLEALRALQGRLNMQRCDGLQHCELEGPDPLPQRPSWFHVSGIDKAVGGWAAGCRGVPKGWVEMTGAEVHARFRRHGLSPCHVTLLEPGAAVAAPEQAHGRPQARSQPNHRYANGPGRRDEVTETQAALVRIIDEQKVDLVLQRAHLLDRAWRVTSYAEYANSLAS
ncbi:hypothetical protein V8C86DRAFT_3141883 [Haematococcus lacustris]